MSVMAFARIQSVVRPVRFSIPLRLTMPRLGAFRLVMPSTIPHVRFSCGLTDRVARSKLASSISMTVESGR